MNGDSYEDIELDGLRLNNTDSDIEDPPFISNFQPESPIFSC